MALPTGGARDWREVAESNFEPSELLGSSEGMLKYFVGA